MFYLNTQTLHTQKEGDKAEDTYKCGEFEYQFSAKWNLSNHIRDIHEPKLTASSFNKVDANFLKKSAGTGMKTRIIKQKLHPMLKTKIWINLQNQPDQKSVMTVVRHFGRKLRCCFTGRMNIQEKFNFVKTHSIVNLKPVPSFMNQIFPRASYNQSHH